MSTPMSSSATPAPGTVVPVGTSEIAASASLPPPPSYNINQLTPPAADVSNAFRKEDYTVRQWDDHINYTVTAYAYVTGASIEDPNFTTIGGEIWVILVHSGSCKAAPLFQSVKINVKASIDGLLLGDTSSFKAEQQLPPTGSGEPQYDPNGERTGYTRFTIQYDRLMTLIRNGGMDSLSFDAKYEDVFNIYLSGQQSGEVTFDGKGVEFTTSGTGMWDSFIMPIRGFSVFSTRMRIDEISMNIDYDVNVSAGSSELTWGTGGSQKFSLSLVPRPPGE
ncbi:hypothetical protein SCP_0102480 [Sparassis crispa]|uniref:PLAT domain-containing protein n=1 Tax=Sparassis crispa TaxID=139825 RepID=A0A401G5D4_9APHY|nr:hypothetical protein SCP_0102480 [Sparassis crispa]GBE77375.1 hypothetical protein SCP_0102480 [Sparassis crispa]